MKLTRDITVVSAHAQQQKKMLRKAIIVDQPDFDDPIAQEMWQYIEQVNTLICAALETYRRMEAFKNLALDA